MSVRRASVAFLAALSVVVASCGDDGGGAAPVVEVPTEAETVIALEVIDGELTGGSRQVDVDAGDKVRLRLTGDTDDLVHVHGYDLYLDPVNGAGELEFDALIPGTFEIELETSGRLLVRMTVS